MTTTLAVTVVGMVAIAVCGFLGRRKPSASLAEWTVGGRNFGTLTMWFLQAGEAFTTFTFLAVAGIAFTGGAAATYAIPYIPLAFIALYFLGPRLWALGKQHNYLTQADFFAERYDSRGFGKLVAVVGVVFLLPYLQLQITGLGLVVQLVTGSKTSGVWSMVIATVLTVAFVLWSGIRGLAKTAYLKDALMVIAMVVLIVAVPIHYAGGIGNLFDRIMQTRPDLLTVQHGTAFNQTWWLTGVLISAIGSAFMTLPHLWPPLLSAGSRKVLRRNYIFLPIYQIVIILPVIIGFVGVLALPKETSSNGVLLTLAAGALPAWLTGVIAVAAAASAMVPAAGLAIGISTLVAQNLVPTRSDRAALRVNHAIVIVAATLALVLGITRPDLLANLLLLTFSGLSQLAPAFICALGRRRLLSLAAAVSGLVAGVAVVVAMTFANIDIAHINVGIIGLVVNLVVAGLVEGAVRMARGAGDRAERTADNSYTPVPTASGAH